ncbi:hypothetical protein PCC7424_3933 [Gloeothece citriformis PCC 7424]|uniref:Uncharacterized protein n=1 Tax=Gloeothece citriformis (strain PCC 7424) TaxID=65393 RepID=B7KKH5_GLOC7|nr:hypothetical protein PCC7424_3933 [Gloeothece citriformis PCC 7424]
MDVASPSNELGKLGNNKPPEENILDRLALVKLEKLVVKQ